MNIETARTVLRGFHLEDVDDLQEILGDEQVMEYLEPPYERDRTEEFLKEFCIEGKNALAVEHKESGKVIGYVLFKSCGQREVYEIAWVFHRSFWRMGYAYEACQALIVYAFKHMELQKIFAETIDPVKSAGLMKKLGMQLEGIQRKQTRNVRGEWADLYLYGLLREEFEEKEKYGGKARE
ncbi:MAG: GNAT family N-acetyltransferase [Acetatifactor sp.]|nr:GNAT family N-acetyltransferase [Acetatifactor sp.]